MRTPALPSHVAPVHARHGSYSPAIAGSSRHTWPCRTTRTCSRHPTRPSNSEMFACAAAVEADEDGFHAIMIDNHARDNLLALMTGAEPST